MIDLFKEEKTISEQLKYHITDDRVFGKMYYGDVIDFIDLTKLEEAKQQVMACDGLVLLYGFGAALVHPGDTLVYFDMARWEIQMRYRAGMGNYKCSNYDEDPLRKNKRGLFIEWRIADKHKASLFERMDYVCDTNKKMEPKMISGDAFRSALQQIAKQPFRTVPYLSLIHISQGHIHAISPSCNASTCEVYEIWSGEAYIYMQQYGGDDAGNCYAVHAKAGDVVIVPPGWVHEMCIRDRDYIKGKGEMLL